MPTRFATIERAALADSLLAAGPDAPTLCAGWATRDLAAHLVLRERKPVAAAGILIKPLAARTERVQAGLAAGDYPALVEQVRQPPKWPPFGVPAVHEAANLNEMFVHHEDVRRAVPGWEPRVLDPGYVQALGKRLKPMAKLALRRFPAAITVRPAGAEPFTTGAGGPVIEVSGDVGELTLFLAGRQAQTRVEIAGDAALAERLRKARLGV